MGGIDLEVIARIHTDFPTKFGVPRQSGLVDALKGRVVFEPPYRNPDALRGLEGFSHIWLIWQFSEVKRARWSATVRPPRLGGNARMGVFATRSPFRPNPVGLSCVRLERIELDSPEGPVLHVAGADMMDGTPVYDIKPYLPFVDCHPEATGGFADPVKEKALRVEFPPELQKQLPEDAREALCAVLAQDPRPSYQSDPKRLYGVPFAGWDVRFTVEDGVLRVREVERLEAEPSGGPPREIPSARS